MYENNCLEKVIYEFINAVKIRGKLSNFVLLNISTTDVNYKAIIKSEVPLNDSFL